MDDWEEFKAIVNNYSLTELEEYVYYENKKMPLDEKMVRLVDSWTNINNSTNIAKLFKKMVENGGELERELVKEIVGDGPMSAMTSPNHPRNWSFVFIRKENGYHLREEVMKYLE